MGDASPPIGEIEREVRDLASGYFPEDNPDAVSLQRFMTLVRELIGVRGKTMNIFKQPKIADVCVDDIAKVLTASSRNEQITKKQERMALRDREIQRVLKTWFPNIDGSDISARTFACVFLYLNETYIKIEALMRKLPQNATLQDLILSAQSADAQTMRSASSGVKKRMPESSPSIAKGKDETHLTENPPENPDKE